MHKRRLKDKLFANHIFSCIKCHEPQTQLSSLTKDSELGESNFEVTVGQRVLDCL